MTLEISDRRLEITSIIELLSKVQIVRMSDSGEYKYCLFLAKQGLELLVDELIEQVKNGTKI